MWNKVDGWSSLPETDEPVIVTMPWGEVFYEAEMRWIACPSTKLWFVVVDGLEVAFYPEADDAPVAWMPALPAFEEEAAVITDLYDEDGDTTFRCQCGASLWGKPGEIIDCWHLGCNRVHTVKVYVETRRLK